MIAVTTFSKTGYEVYGKKFLETFVKHWPCKIVVYYEEKPDFEHEKIEYRSFFEIPNVQTFYEYLKNVPMAHGIVNGKYDYNKDAWKFTRKVFAQLDAFNEGGKVFWLDADIETQKDVPEDFLMGLFDGKSLCYLGRPNFYTETGFIGFDTEHEDFPLFKSEYTRCLQKGIFLTLPRWHDCEIFDWARKETPGNDLSPFKGGINVFPKSVLGEYMIHNKGDRKFGAKK